MLSKQEGPSFQLHKEFNSRKWFIIITLTSIAINVDSLTLKLKYLLEYPKIDSPLSGLKQILYSIVLPEAILSKATMADGVIIVSGTTEIKFSDSWVLSTLYNI